MSARPSLRAATPSDCALILSFIRELADYEKLAHEVVATEAGLREQLFGATPRAQVVIAELGGEPVGFALYFHNFSTFTGRAGLYLEDLYVRPSARGAGVGKRLMQHLAKLAVARDCARFEWAVLDWNEPAIRFYRSIGAVGMDSWRVQRLAGDALAKLANEAG
ncbi:MAG TPA: GNAT family N-acetyltransferase [Xanthomonadales bacterium]|nr:GNAT family N-acetyltransferase [Xanthomonadales bacterium]